MTEWPSVRLGEIAETASGGTPDRKNLDYFGGPIPWVKSGELRDRSITSTEEKITELGLKNSAAKLFPPGTLLVAMYGATVGKTAILNIEAATNQAVCAIFPKSDTADTKFIRFALMYRRPQLLNQRHGGAQPNVSQQIIRDLSIPLPTLEEQRKIAAILGLIQRAIEQQQYLLTLTDELKNTLLGQLFTHGIHHGPKRQTDLGPIPQSWQVMEFDRFATLQRGKDLTKAQFKNGNIPVAGSNGVIGYHNVANVKAPGVTVGRSGSVGRVTLYETDFWAHNTALYVRDFHGNDPVFVSYYLSILNLQRFKSGASVPTLDRNQFRLMPVAVPPKDEQKEIANIIMIVDRKINIHRTKHVALRALFRTLLLKLMTANIRLHDLGLAELEKAAA
jgi:type I restriction enzyme S subunit